MSNKIATNKYIRDAFISAIDDSVSDKTTLQNAINEHIGEVLTSYMGQTNVDLNRCMKRDDQQITVDTLYLDELWQEMIPYSVDPLYNYYENPFYDIHGDGGKLVSISDIEGTFNLNKTKLLNVTNNNSNISIRYTDNGSDTFDAFDSTVYVGISTDHSNSQFMLFDAFQDVTLENSMDIAISQPRIDNHLVVAGYTDDWEPGDNIAIEIEVRIPHLDNISINSMPITLQIQENNSISIDPYFWNDDGEAAHGFYYTDMSLEDLKSIWEIDLDMCISNLIVDTWGTIDFSNFYFYTMGGTKIYASQALTNCTPTSHLLYDCYGYSLLNPEVTFNSYTSININTTYLDTEQDYYISLYYTVGSYHFMPVLYFYVHEDGSITPTGQRIYINMTYPGLTISIYGYSYGDMAVYGDGQMSFDPIYLSGADNIDLTESMLFLDNMSIDGSGCSESAWSVRFMYNTSEFQVIDGENGDWWYDINMIPSNVTYASLRVWAQTSKYIYIDELLTT